jgi:hypothetical protein
VWHGHGVYCYSSGDKYCGRFVEGKRCGQGTLYKANGEVMQGVWKDGEMLSASCGVL